MGLSRLLKSHLGVMCLFLRELGLVVLTGCASQPAPIDTHPVSVDLQSEITAFASQAWPVAQNISQPDELRPCCAFGHNLRVALWGIPMPFYSVGNIIDVDNLGVHEYNDDPMHTFSSLLGLNDEQVGLIYTHRGGVIDIAHVRDTADYVLFLFSSIQPHLGEDWQLSLGDELATRQLRLFAVQVPADQAQRYTLSAYLAADTAYRLAAWHEIAQWYGYRAFWIFSEEVSAFSPEDLYSNLVGARLALSVILQGNAGSKEQFSAAMTKLLPQALNELGAVSVEQTRAMLDSIDGLWWDSHQRLPEKFLVLYRDYNTASNRVPSSPPREIIHSLRLHIPEHLDQYTINALGGLYLLPTKDMGTLPAPPSVHYWTVKDFQGLADHAKEIDTALLQQKVADGQ